MKDPRMEYIRKLETMLSSVYDAAQISVISNTALKALSDYEITERCTDLAPLDDFNEKILKRFRACLLIEGKAESTAAQYLRTCRKLEDLLHKRYDEVGVYDLRYFLALEMERGLKSSTMQSYRANLSAFFSWLTNEDIIPKNPFLQIATIKCDKKVRKAFSDVELDALRSACKRTKERAILEILLSTGIRVAELASMEVHDIDRIALSVHVRHGKGSKERITYISEVAMKHLMTYLNGRKETGPILLYNKNHEAISTDGIRHILNTVADRAGVEDVHPHRFRRTFATVMYKRGMPVQEIQALLGHSNINTTMLYIQMDDTQLQASYKKHIA